LNKHQIVAEVQVKHKTISEIQLEFFELSNNLEDAHLNRRELNTIEEIVSISQEQQALFPENVYRGVENVVKYCDETGVTTTKIAQIKPDTKLQSINYNRLFIKSVESDPLYDMYHVFLINNMDAIRNMKEPRDFKTLDKNVVT